MDARAWSPSLVLCSLCCPLFFMRRWSLVGRAFDMFSWTTCMATVGYCVFWTLRGAYADIPFVSESVYIQVRACDRAGEV